MNFNKALSCIASRYPKLPLSRITDNLFLYRSLSSTVKSTNISIKSLLKEESSTYYTKLIEKSSVCYYSTVANEEQSKFKNPVITVPVLNFDELTFESPVTHHDLCNELQVCNSIEEQMKALTSALALSPDDIENRLCFMKLIESLLKPFFGEIKIQLFGSTLNGFGFKGCDIDMSFETFSAEREKVPLLEAPDVPLICEVMNGKVLPSEISSFPPKEQLIFIHSVFMEFYKESEDPTIFINAHIPLIRFYHDKFGLKCDLTCRNRVAFANTKLLFLLGKLDDRVIPLMMTIRYWAKHVQLIGKGLMFNTYTVSLLVIHFLQTRNPPVLPTAEHILSLSDSLGIEDMSDKSFLQIRNHIPPSENKQTLSELLKEFFFYYLYFDFTRVICPLIGGSVPREEFFRSINTRKFRMNSICVQDPMLTTHNVAELVDYKHCKKLFTELLAACRLFQNGTDLSPSPNKWGISILLDKPDEYLPHNCSWQKSISLVVPFITKQIISDLRRDDPKLFTAETLVFLLKHIFFFECRSLDMSDVIGMLKRHDQEMEKQKREFQSKNEFISTKVMEVYQKYNINKQPIPVNLQKFDDALMLEEFQKFNSKNKLLLCVECKAPRNAWLGRDHVSLESLPENTLNNVIETEHYISTQTAKQNELYLSEKKEKPRPFEFFFECYESPDLPESSLLVNFRPFRKTNFNPVLGMFLKEYFPKLINKLNEDC